MAALDYQLDAARPESRQLHVALEFDRGIGGDPNAIELFLPAWTPGSYLIREYARQLSRVEAFDAETGAALVCMKTAKNRFRVARSPDTARVRVTWSVYAHELTVRTADVSDAHAYWNNACVLLWPVDSPQLDCRLEVALPSNWQGRSAMPSSPAPSGTLAWTATDLDHAIDSPCLLGEFESLEFEVLGVPHTVVLDGLNGIVPPKTFVDDLTAIIQAAADVFGGKLPYEDYVFLCLFTDDGYGGLEHRNSCTLLSKRTALSEDNSYREFLALCAHELFHAWNVKRMRPQELWAFDYERENYTPMLWLAEGWTAYYDDLLGLRAGRCTVEKYLKVAAKNIQRMLANAGRHQLSLAESSFDAWIRLYRPDENTRNSSQNYYVNGAVAAMSLDLFLRRASGGRKCLDDVLRALYASTFGEGRGYVLDDVEQAVAGVGGAGAAELLHAMTHEVLNPPLEDLFASFGIRCKIDSGGKPHLGVTFAAGSTRIASVTNGTPADRGGLHPGDEVLALQGLRATEDSWRDVFRSVAATDKPLEVLFARRGVIKSLTITPAPTNISVDLEIDADATAERVELRKGWLRTLARAVQQSPGG